MAFSYLTPVREGHTRCVVDFRENESRTCIPMARQRRLRKYSSEISSPEKLMQIAPVSYQIGKIKEFLLSRRPVFERVHNNLLGTGSEIPRGRNVICSSASTIFSSNIHRSTQHSVLILTCSFAEIVEAVELSESGGPRMLNYESKLKL